MLEMAFQTVVAEGFLLLRDTMNWFGITALVVAAIGAVLGHHHTKSPLRPVLAVGLVNMTVIGVGVTLVGSRMAGRALALTSGSVLMQFVLALSLALSLVLTGRRKKCECGATFRIAALLSFVLTVTSVIILLSSDLRSWYPEVVQLVGLISLGLFVFSGYRLWQKGWRDRADIRFWLFIATVLASVHGLLTLAGADNLLLLSAADFARNAAYLVMASGMVIGISQSLSRAELRVMNLYLANEEVQEEMEERKWAEELLRESRLFAESIVESIREPLLVLDTELRVIRANQSFYTTFNLKPKRTLTRALGEIGRGQWNDPELLEKLGRVIPKAAHFEDYEMTRAFKGIGSKTILLNARRIDQKDVKTNLILLTMYDITERKIAQEEARRLARGVESAAESIIMTDVDGAILYVNPAFTELTGYTADEVIGQKANILKSAAYEEMWQTILAGKVWSGEVVNTKKDGVRFDAYLTIAPVFDEQDKLEGFVSVQNDITELKRAKEELALHAKELARSNAELEQFAYIASHDLQEPLRMVSSYCQLLQRRYHGKLDADADDFIEYAVDGAKRMQVLINDLLEYSRVGTHGKPFESTDCSKVLEKALDNLKVSIQDCNAKIVENKLPVAIADQTQLVQVFQNLIGNAMKFRKGNEPKIVIDSRKQNGEWVFSVKDDGIGIETEFADRIFVIFQRLHNRKEYSGTGIGLAICKKIIERHGGRIWVESAAGEGSTFYFTLPRRKKMRLKI